MATTQLADVYVPLTFARRSQQAQLEMNAFIGSGIAQADPAIATQFAAGGNIGELPQFNGITIQEPNYSTDDNTSNAVPQKIGSVKQLLRSASRNDHWSAMDLTRELADSDPVAAITGRIGAFWSSDDEKRLINSVEGILADNVANDSGDMLHNIATDDAGAVTDAERISSEAIALGAQTMGDHSRNIAAIAMHSVQHTRLAIRGMIKTVTNDKDASLTYDTYLGKRIVIDDSLTPEVGTNRLTYTVALFGAGAVGYANGKVQTPSEMSRNPLAGDGGGESIISSRVNTIFHPNGFSFLSASVAGNSATYAELKDASNWNRVVARKAVNLAFIKVND